MRNQFRSQILVCMFFAVAVVAGGIRFTQACAGGPVCTSSRRVSRRVLMTGQHKGHPSARDNVPHYRTYLTGAEVTMAGVLKLAGHHTGGVGKWSFGDAETEGRVANHGFSFWFGYLNQDHAHYSYTESVDDDEGRFELTANSTSREHSRHDRLTERALQFIRDWDERLMQNAATPSDRYKVGKLFRGSPI